MQRTDISDLLDRTFGELTVTGIANPYISPKGRTETRYLCRCSCGNNKIYRRSQLVTNRVVSCGCKRNNFWNLYNEQTRSCYIGKRYGKLTVESYDKNSGKYLCRCDCGTKTLISVSNLKSAKSCGGKKPCIAICANVLPAKWKSGSIVMSFSQILCRTVPHVKQGTTRHP